MKYLVFTLCYKHDNPNLVMCNDENELRSYLNSEYGSNYDYCESAYTNKLNNMSIQEFIEV